MDWININTDKPKNLQEVIVCFNDNGRRVITIATYVAPNSVLEEDFLSEDAEGCSDYDAEKDCYWVTEGFFEYMTTSDQSWLISGEITHWMAKPKLPELLTP